MHGEESSSATHSLWLYTLWRSVIAQKALKSKQVVFISWLSWRWRSECFESIDVSWRRCTHYSGVGLSLRPLNCEWGYLLLLNIIDVSRRLTCHSYTHKAIEFEQPTDNIVQQPTDTIVQQSRHIGVWSRPGHQATVKTVSKNHIDYARSPSVVMYSSEIQDVHSNLLTMRRSKGRVFSIRHHVNFAKWSCHLGCLYLHVKLLLCSAKKLPWTHVVLSPYEFRDDCSV